MCRPGDGPIYVGVPPLFLGTRLFPFPDLWRDVIVVAVHRLAIFPCCYDRTPGDIGVMTLNTTNCNTGTSPSSSAGRCRALGLPNSGWVLAKYRPSSGKNTLADIE